MFSEMSVSLKSWFLFLRCFIKLCLKDWFNVTATSTIDLEHTIWIKHGFKQISIQVYVVSKHWDFNLRIGSGRRKGTRSKHHKALTLLKHEDLV